MSVPLVALPIQAQTAVSAAALPAPLGVSSPQDLEQLRTLIASTSGPAPAQAPAAPSQAAPSTEVTPTTLGDSILNGLTNFNSGYNHGLESINTRINHLASTDPLKLGMDFGEVMALQIEVTQWSMSVTGMDNASKAGTNTIKELSRGG
ncbi:MAG: hypothetical protein ACAI34_18535 [Verrucomicrobium sp.]|nr:hypothetical protein [Verrucomicrobium sp.]